MRPRTDIPVLNIWSDLTHICTNMCIRCDFVIAFVIHTPVFQILYWSRLPLWELTCSDKAIFVCSIIMLTKSRVTDNSMIKRSPPWLIDQRFVGRSLSTRRGGVPTLQLKWFIKVTVLLPWSLRLGDLLDLIYCVCLDQSIISLFANGVNFLSLL